MDKFTIHMLAPITNPELRWKSKTPWSEKMNKPVKPEVSETVEKTPWGTGKMLISTPKEIMSYLEHIPKGKLLTTGTLRDAMARDQNADFTCPLTTGIFLRICAEFTEDQLLSGKKKITPYWRCIKEDGCLNPKFPGGIVRHAEWLRQEGFTIIPKGKKNLMVKDFASYLYKI